MERALRVTEELMVFILNKREKPLKGSSDYTQTVSVISAIIYELLHDEYVIMDEKQKISINHEKEKPTINYCSEVYNYILNDNKERKIDNLISKLIDKTEIYKMIQNNLLAMGCITETEEKILLFTQARITVNEAVLDNLVQKIRTEFLDEGELSDDIVFLTFILNQNNILKNFFSKYENTQLKNRLKEIKNEPIGKIAKNMIDSMTTMIIVIATM